MQDALVNLIFASDAGIATFVAKSFLDSNNIYIFSR